MAESCQRNLQLRLADHLDALVVVMGSPRGLSDPSLGTFANMAAKADLIVALGKPVDFTLASAGPPRGELGGRERRARSIAACPEESR